MYSRTYSQTMTAAVMFVAVVISLPTCAEAAPQSREQAAAEEIGQLLTGDGVSREGGAGCTTITDSAGGQQTNDTFERHTLSLLPTINTDAQQQASLGTVAIAQPRATSTEREVVKNLLGGQKTIWTSPTRIERSDARWLIPLVAVTAVMIPTDTRVSDQLTDSEDLNKVSRGISEIGHGYTMFVTAGTVYLMGKLGDNDRAREIGLRGLEALVHSAVVIGAIKLATNRERPDKESGNGRFWAGGKSFASGHSAFGWALATVLAEEYKDARWVQVGVYSMATTVAVTRVLGRKHFPSDVLVGSTIGHLIGRLVARRHRAGLSQERTAVIAPHFSPATRSYGFTVSLGF